MAINPIDTLIIDLTTESLGSTEATAPPARQGELLQDLGQVARIGWSPRPGNIGKEMSHGLT